MAVSTGLALRTDLYQLTMMQGYWSTGRAAEPAAFELFFRSIPESGGYCIAAGIEDALEIVAGACFHDDDIEYLRSQSLFTEGFLDSLRSFRFRGDVRAVPEGSCVFPNEPLFEVTGGLLEAQYFESILLNTINFQTLIATKASRIARQARPARVVDFGLRRAHGPDGALSAAKAAYLAGATGTSNVEAGRRFGIPVVGTHAHSWIMSFPTERTAFEEFAKVFPDSSVLLIDTYDTLESGLPNAIAVGRELKARGHKLSGIRLDSGDLAYLARACRAALDEAGLADVSIVASSDIDEYVVRDLKLQGAPIDLYGVGTRLATAFQEPALNGVYKLVALRRNDRWEPKIKLSSNPAKTTIPGRKQLWRWESDGRFLGDCLSIDGEDPPRRMTHPDHAHLSTDLAGKTLLPILEPRLRGGEPIRAAESFDALRSRVERQLDALPDEHQRLVNPHVYRVGLSDRLWELRQEMVQAARKPAG